MIKDEIRFLDKNPDWTCRRAAGFHEFFRKEDIQKYMFKYKIVREVELYFLREYNYHTQEYWTFAGPYETLHAACNAYLILRSVRLLTAKE